MVVAAPPLPRPPQGGLGFYKGQQTSSGHHSDTGVASVLSLRVSGLVDQIHSGIGEPAYLHLVEIVVWWLPEIV